MSKVRIDTSLKVNGQRLWDSLMELAKIGATPKGGVRRLTLTELDGQGRDLVIGWGKDAGLSVRIDKIGNIFMRREGLDPDLPPIVGGSHIDTQPSGGKFDGNFGVLAALEVMRTLNDHDVQTEAPLEVAIWTNEEGARFVPVMMGSGVFCGAFSLETAYAAKDVDGKTVREELENIGYIGPEEPGQHPMGSYFEAHIEQGPILEDEDKVIGVVTAVLGLRWYDCTITGVDAHTGSTPMHLRKDALQVATHVMQQVRQIGLRHQPYGRGTVGFVQVEPNSRNVIPGLVRFSIDFRNVSDELLDTMHEELEVVIREEAARSGLDIQLTQVSYFPPCPFHEDCIGAVRHAAEELGYAHQDIVSGAGHDAVYAARMTPTSMIFVPCKDGISHNELEDAKPEHLTAGANVLLHAMLQRASIVGGEGG